MLVMVALPVQLMLSTPGPKYSTTLLVPPWTVSRPQTCRITSLGEVQPDRAPVSRIPMSLGWSTSQGRPAMTSPASAPPTPTAIIPSPPALGVWESVPIMSAPGTA